MILEKSFLLFVVLTVISCKKEQEITKLMYRDLQPKIDSYSKTALELWGEDEKLAVSYFNDSIPDLITGSYIADYHFNLIDDSILKTESIFSPIFLQVGSRGCRPCRAEIPALNDIVEAYANDITFILLMEYDSKEDLLKVANQYHKEINIVYYSDSQNKNRKTSDPSNFSGFKHLVKSLPTNYLINKNRQIIKLTGGATIPQTYKADNGVEVTITLDDAYYNNYKKLEEEMELLIKNDTL